MRTLKTLAAVSFLAAVLATGASAANAATVVDVQFSRDAGLQQTGAAVIGSAGDTWNDFLGNVGSGSLVDATGAASGISLSFSAALVYESDPGFTAFTGTPWANLMQGYLVDYDWSNGIDLKFSGLVPGQAYGFWIYTQGDNNSDQRQLNLSANGGAVQLAQQASGDNTFVLGRNYTYLTSFADSDGVVDIFARDLNGEANINGVQLMAVPESSSLALMLAGFVFFGGAVLRKSRAR